MASETARPTSPGLPTMPTELVLDILGHLDVNELKNLRPTCKRMRAIIQDVTEQKLVKEHERLAANTSVAEFSGLSLLDTARLYFAKYGRLESPAPSSVLVHCWNIAKLYRGSADKLAKKEAGFSIANPGVYFSIPRVVACFIYTDMAHRDPVRVRQHLASFEEADSNVRDILEDVCEGVLEVYSDEGMLRQFVYGSFADSALSASETMEACGDIKSRPFAGEAWDEGDLARERGHLHEALGCFYQQSKPKSRCRDRVGRNVDARICRLLNLRSPGEDYRYTPTSEAAAKYLGPYLQRPEDKLRLVAVLQDLTVVAGT